MKLTRVEEQQHLRVVEDWDEAPPPPARLHVLLDDWDPVRDGSDLLRDEWDDTVSLSTDAGVYKSSEARQVRRDRVRVLLSDAVRHE